jgi:hypothetical protein
MRDVGSRVGCIKKADDKEVHIYGYGVYEGDFKNPDAGGLFGAIDNPRIKLDSGDIVWGRECWWGPEEKVKESIGGRTVVEASITKDREEYEAHKKQLQKEIEEVQKKKAEGEANGGGEGPGAIPEAGNGVAGGA